MNNEQKNILVKAKEAKGMGTKKALEEVNQEYADRVAELEAEGMTTSDAQGCADAEVMARNTIAPVKELLTKTTLKEAMAHLPAIDFDKTPQPIINGKKLFPQMEKNQGGRITGALCIKIWESESEEIDENGDRQIVDCYMYNIYDNSEGEGESIDGGCCTGSIHDALEMAVSQSL